MHYYFHPPPSLQTDFFQTLHVPPQHECLHQSQSQAESFRAVFQNTSSSASIQDVLDTAPYKCFCDHFKRLARINIPHL